MRRLSLMSRNFRGAWRTAYRVRKLSPTLKKLSRCGLRLHANLDEPFRSRKVEGLFSRSAV